jgi:hypothetical protein
MSPVLSAAALAIGAVIAIDLAVIATGGGSAASFRPAGPIGSIQAVALTNGQLYFGTLKSEASGEIVLADVFDLATNTKQDGGERATQLIRRLTGSVYGPSDLAIPIDKILSTETVGPDSTVAKAMASMKTAAGAPK